MNKYRNIPTIVDGIKFASKKEAKRYSELKLLEKGGLISELRCQQAFPIVMGTVNVCKYVSDFTYRENNAPVVEDCKGVKTAIYRLKKKLMLAFYNIAIKET